jgi:hypothetical protein
MRDISETPNRYGAEGMKLRRNGQPPGRPMQPAAVVGAGP